MVVAIVLGALCGIAGFLPLTVGLRLARKATATSNFGHAGALLLGVLLSFLVLAAAFIGCVFVSRTSVLPFGLAEVGGLVVSTLVFGLSTIVRK